MGNKARFSPQIMGKVWLLHKKNLDSTEIAQCLSISKASSVRIIGIMKLAEANDIEALDNFNGKGCYLEHKKYAKEYFGIPEQLKPESEPAPSLHDNTAAAMKKIITALDRQNELLEMICAELGINKEVSK